ncbi:Alpha/beta hydrolase domain-containing protein 17B, partial [Lemmus lemmus]
EGGLRTSQGRPCGADGDHGRATPQAGEPRRRPPLAPGPLVSRTRTRVEGGITRSAPGHRSARSRPRRAGSGRAARRVGGGRRPAEDSASAAAAAQLQKMNNLSFSELCCLFCCPPCPGKIASKLAFLPPDPTYTLMCDESGSRWTLHLSERADWQYSSREKDAIECFMTRTSKGNRIACMFVRCSPSAKYTLLFSHGNAVDLGQMSSFYIGLGSRINCNIFSYDYSGYGASSGKPTEKNLYADVEAAWLALRTSIDKISKITSPVLIIHGTEDEVIDFSHGLALFERCQRPVEPLWVEGAGHNDVELYGQYLERLKQFVSQELVNL